MFDLASDRESPDASARERVRALFVGHAGSPTGFARVLHSLLPRLSHRYDVHHLGINFHGAAPDCGWTVHHNPRPDDRYAEHALETLIAALQPRLIFVLDEVRVAARLQPVLQTRGPGARAVLYAAIDGRLPLSPEDVRALSGFDRLVAFTRFGREALVDAAAAVQARTPDFRLPPIGIVPHGVDTSVFHPLARPAPAPGAWVPDPADPRVAAGRAAARRQLFPERRDLDEAFIVLNANRNQPFKRIDVTLRGFAAFARDKPADVLLYLHMGTAAPAPGTTPLADALGIRDRVLVTARSPHHPDVTSDRLNVIYNACDVGLNTSEGEGWGLVSVEHAATGAAQIVPRHTACAELWADAALLVEPVDRDRADAEEYERSGLTVTPDGVAGALERLYRDRELRRGLSIAAYRIARREDLQWDEIGRMWDREFRALLASG